MECLGVSYPCVPHASSDLPLGIPTSAEAAATWVSYHYLTGDSHGQPLVGLKRCRGLVRHLQRLWGSTEVHLCLSKRWIWKCPGISLWLAIWQDLKGSESPTVEILKWLNHALKASALWKKTPGSWQVLSCLSARRSVPLRWECSLQPTAQPEPWTVINQLSTFDSANKSCTAKRLPQVLSIPWAWWSWCESEWFVYDLHVASRRKLSTWCLLQLQAHPKLPQLPTCCDGHWSTPHRLRDSSSALKASNASTFHRPSHG